MIQPLRGEEGTIEGLVLFGIDGTERVRSRLVKIPKRRTECAPRCTPRLRGDATMCLGSCKTWSERRREMSKETNYADLKAGRATCEFCDAPVTLSAVVDTVDVGTFGNEGRKLRLAR